MLMFLSKTIVCSLKLRNSQRKRYALLLSGLVFNKFSTNHYAASHQRVWTHKTMDSNDQNPVLKISQGLIRGAKCQSIYDDDYYGFEGIPYGQPPIDELRFKSPLPAKSWSDIRDCLDFDIKPMQKNHQGEIEGSEDCLYLNVFAKRLNAEQKLPVMVYIYGGGFNTGSCIKTKYGPDYFMQEDVILVVFNYRVSVFGFLSLNEPSLDVPGNAGLKDQLLALKWVQDNIEHFGGDKENITLFGESAGAASVHYMMCTPQAKGLFHKAICMSGCILNDWAYTENTTDLPYRLACENGYKGGNDDQSVLKFLQNCSIAELLNLNALNIEAAKKGSFFLFTPSIEPYVNEKSIVAKPLLESLKTAWGNAIPLIIGGTSFEGLVKYPFIKHIPSLLSIYKTAPEKLLPSAVLVGKSESEQKLLIESLKELHFAESNASAENELMSNLDHSSYSSFWHGFHRVVKSRQLLATAATYHYLFDFDSPTYNHHRQIFCGSDITKGVAHADDLSYIFSSSYSGKLETDSKEYLTLRRMIDLWSSFAKSSNPNCVYTKESKWKPLAEADVYTWLRISDDIKFEKMSAEFKRKLDGWNSFYGDSLL